MSPPTVNTEVDDFLDRHLDAIAEAIREPDLEIVHGPHCRSGERVWLFSWRWPFVQTWISKSICCCDITAILAGHRKQKQYCDEIVQVLNGTPHLDLTPGG